MSVHRLGPLVALNANLAAVRHLTPVPDPKPPPRLAERGAAQPSIAELERWATVLRIDCVRMLAVAKSGHLDSSLSAADILTALYYRVLRHDPRQPGLAGARPLRALQGPRGADPVRGARPARLLPARGPDGAAPDRRPAPGPPRHAAARPGIEVSTGSLGQGLSMCARHLLLRCGSTASTRPPRSSACSPTATARRARPGRRRRRLPHFGVPNLTAIVDYNHLQTDGTTEEVMDIGDVRAKFEAFGWDAVEIDGHDMEQVVEALERSRDAATSRRRSSPRRRRARASRRWRAGSASTARPRSARSTPPRRWRS